MKAICVKDKRKKFFVQNISGNPAIVLIFPITRDGPGSLTKWESAISFINESRIDTFIVIDKTSKGTATQYFMENFNLEDKNLFVLPRSIKESHYETLGQITLDNNFWIMQLHDDDDWSGHIKLPEVVDLQASYFSKFFMVGKSNEIIEKFGFTTPGRVNFTLVPSRIWNQFANFIENQNYHVAGSLDSTLNQMVQLSCKLVPIPDFSYYYDNHNWETRKSSKSSLTKLAANDGWGDWVSIDIALFGRLLDNLSSLYYVKDFVTQLDIKEAHKSLMEHFNPRLRRRVLLKFEILLLRSELILSNTLGLGIDRIDWAGLAEQRLNRALFIRNSWAVKNLDQVIKLVESLEATNHFSILQYRFRFWKDTLAALEVLLRD